MAYTADINIVVRGQAAVNKLQRDLDELGQKIDDIAKRRIGPSTALETFNAQLAEAQKRLTEVAAGTNTEAEAIKNYVTALGNANAATERQNNLIKEEIELRRRQKLALSGIRETTQYTGPIGPGPASPVGALVGQKSPVAERIRRTLDAQRDQVTLEEALLKLEQKSSQELNKQLQIRGELAAKTALEVNTLIAKAAAGPQISQLLLPAAAPGAPAMGGGARRRITGPVERLGGARTEDQAAMALRFAQALKEQVRPLSQIDALYAGITGQAAKLQQIKALPDSAMLNATARGIKQLETAEDRLNNERAESVARLQQIDRLEESRRRRAAKLRDRAAYEAPAGFSPAAVSGNNVMRGRLGGALSSGIIGGGFPLLFGQGPVAAIGGAAGGLAGGLLGGGFGFALSIAGTALGDLVTQSETLDRSLASLNAGITSTGSASLTTADDVKQLAKNLNITNDEAVQLVGTFSQFGNGQTREALAAIFGNIGGAATFETIAKAGIDEKNALASIFELRKYIGNEAATQLALQLDAAGATQTQAALLKLLVERSIQISVATKSQVQFTDTLLSTWENIVAGVAGALSLAIKFIQKMREGTLLKLPFLDQVANIMAGVKARSPEQIAQQNAAQTAKELRAYQDQIRKALQQETGAVTLQSTMGNQFKTKAKPPESRAPQLREELDALYAIGQAEDRIRDLQFQGREIMAVRAEQDKVLADIERDRVKAILSANYASEKDLINQIALQRIENLRLETADKERAVRQKKFEEDLQAAAAVRQSVQSFVQIRKEQEFQAQYAKTYNRLVTEGLLPAEAERIANYEKLVAQQLDAVAEQIKITDLAIIEAKARGAITVDLEKQLKIYKDQQNAIKGEAVKGPGEGPTGRQRLEDQVGKLRGELNTLLGPINQITVAAEGIGSAFADSFKGAISGAMTAQEALASFFQSVADRFLDMAAQIIAKWIEMSILNSVLNLFPGGGGAATGALFGAGAPGAVAGGGIFSGAGPFQFRAAGGPVMAGSPYIVGEKGPELFVPGRSGGIVPNDSLGMGSANVVVNVDASGSNVQGDGNQANQLGKVIGIAVQQELIKQKRPGGLLA